MENVNLAYAQSFLGTPHKTVYSDPAGFKGMGAIDMKTPLNEQHSIGLKAQGVTSGGAGTAGYAMVPVFVDPRVTDQTRKYTPFYELIPKVTNQGMYADYNIITAKGGAISALEDAALGETNTTYDRASTAIKFFYAVGRVTGPSMAAQPAYVLGGLNPGAGSIGPFSDASAPNAKQMEILVKTREMAERLENACINGNASADASEFSGIATLQTSTNGVNKANTALSLDDVHTAVQYAFDDGGRPNLAICSSSVYSDLLKLLTQKIGYLKAEQQVFWGFTTIVLHTMVGSIPVVPSMYMANTYNASALVNSKKIYFLDMSVIEMRVLQDMTYFDLAKTNDSEKFAIKFYGCLINKNTSFCSSVYAIAA